MLQRYILRIGYFRLAFFSDNVFYINLVIHDVGFEKLNSYFRPVPSLKGNYAIHQYLYPEYHDTVVLAVTVYKESYPLLYKATNSITESVSEHDIETITLFNKADYKISDDGKTLSYGKMKISLE